MVQYIQSGVLYVRSEQRGRPRKIFEDDVLQALLDEDGGQTQKQLAENYCM